MYIPSYIRAFSYGLLYSMIDGETWLDGKGGGGTGIPNQTKGGGRARGREIFFDLRITRHC